MIICLHFIGKICVKLRNVEEKGNHIYHVQVHGIYSSVGNGYVHGHGQLIVQSRVMGYILHHFGWLLIEVTKLLQN